MAELTPLDITRLLRQADDGDASAAQQLIPRVYDDLHRLARIHLGRDGDGRTLQPTALVNEVYLRLFHERRNGGQIEWQSREHFFGVAGKLMRWLIVDHARAAGAAKRGGAHVRLSLDEIADTTHLDAHPEHLLAINEALTKLEELFPRAAQVVELRFFMGLTEAETAAALGISDRTARREWAFAKSWLLDRLGETP